MERTLDRREEIDLFVWLFEQFLEMGFGEEEADFLATSEVDYREAKALIDQGCPHQLALEILL